MLKPKVSRQFERDYVRQVKRNKSLEKLDEVMKLIVEEKPLLRKHNDHPLRGNWKGYRDCHVEPDWLLLYRIAGNEVTFERTGTHSDLFG